MNNNMVLFVKKYATFDRAKISEHHNLLVYFQKEKEIPELQKLLEQQHDWKFYNKIDQDEEIQRQDLLECMVANYCSSINLKYFWGENNLKLLLHIEFRNLKQLTFSVDSDYGYIGNIQFLEKLDAPNLVSLDLSNMENGRYSLRPLRKCNFPKLQTLDFSYYYSEPRDFITLFQAHFPCLNTVNIFECQNKQYQGREWMVKMESPFIRQRIEKQLFESKINQEKQ